MKGPRKKGYRDDTPGFLLDQEHWSRAINEMWEVRPTRDSVMDRAQVIKFLEIAEKALIDLVHDPKFAHDLHTVAQLAAQAPDVPPKETVEFRRFLERFLASERALLIQSNMNEDAAVEILADIARIVETIKRSSGRYL